VDNAKVLFAFSSFQSNAERFKNWYKVTIMAIFYCLTQNWLFGLNCLEWNHLPAIPGLPAGLKFKNADHDSCIMAI
jgi:hypothetical protein